MGEVTFSILQVHMVRIITRRFYFVKRYRKIFRPPAVRPSYFAGPMFFPPWRKSETVE